MVEDLCDGKLILDWSTRNANVECKFNDVETHIIAWLNIGIADFIR